MLTFMVPEIKSWKLKSSKTGRSRGYFYHRSRQCLKKDRLLWLSSKDLLISPMNVQFDNPLWGGSITFTRPSTLNLTQLCLQPWGIGSRRWNWKFLSKMFSRNFQFNRRDPILYSLPHGWRQSWVRFKVDGRVKVIGPTQSGLSNWTFMAHKLYGRNKKNFWTWPK